MTGMKAMGREVGVRSVRAIRTHAVVAGVAIALCGASFAVIAGGHLAWERYEKALASDERAEADRARDKGRKPARVLDFLGLKPGMTAMDLLASGGYYTEALSRVVGPSGRVYAQNPAMLLKYRDGANDKALSKRLANDRLPNVTRLDEEVDAISIQKGSVDLVVTALNFHDLYNGPGGVEVATGMSKAVFGLLKPGGVFGVIDHAGSADGDNAALHRMQMRDAAAVLRNSGFKVEMSDLLRNSGDARDKGVFDPSVRGKTDRFLLKATRPGA
jgi:predicted methyltransferase